MGRPIVVRVCTERWYWLGSSSPPPSRVLLDSLDMTHSGRVPVDQRIAVGPVTSVGSIYDRPQALARTTERCFGNIRKLRRQLSHGWPIPGPDCRPQAIRPVASRCMLLAGTLRSAYIAGPARCRTRLAG